MPDLRFRLGFHSSEMNALHLPVTIRKPNASLVKNVKSSETVPLQPGRYFATTILPAGQEITRSFEMRAEDYELSLAPDPEDASSYEWDEERLFLSPNRPLRVVRSDANSPPAPRLRPGPEATLPQLKASTGGIRPGRPYLRALVGNPFEATAVGNLEGLLLPDTGDEGSLAYFQVRSPDSKPMIVQLLEAGVPTIGVVVPDRSRLALNRRPGPEVSGKGRFKVEVLTASPNANLQLRYGLQGSYLRAAQNAAIAEALLHGKLQDPIAAAVSAYSLLRIGELERLHDWTTNLEQWFPWLPDGSALVGEHRASLGDHVGALAAFSRLVERGLPFVSAGLFFAAGRVRLYARLRAKQAGGIDVALARKLLPKLQRFAVAAHAQRPITTLSGMDPARRCAAVLRPGARPGGTYEVLGMAIEEPAIR